MSDIASTPITELSERLSSGALSSHELAQAFLNRIERHRDLGAFLDLNPELVLSEASAADKARSSGVKGALLGIPIALKDIILTRGQKTTCGSKILSNFVPPYDATVTTKLRSAGAIILGKTNMDEFAMGSSNETSHFGVVKNPWDHARVPGGSSGGSAAAVAARLAPAALGTDTGGSIRQPASLCNIVGIKPTYGRVSRYGVIAFASSLDQVGVFAANVRDTALVLQAISGHDTYDATSNNKVVPDFTASCGKDIKGLRIGVPREYFIDGMSPEVRAAVETSLKALEEQGASIVDISLPNTEAAVATYYIIAPAEASSNLARYDGVRFGHRAENVDSLHDLYCRSRSEGFGTEVKRRIMIGTYVLSTGYYDAFYLKAQKVRTVITREFEHAFSKDCDLIACPTSPTTAFKIGEKTSDPLAMYLNDVFTIPVNLAGLPGMSIPCGFDSAGLPIGLQLIGRAWDEETLFRVAARYEQVTDWHKRLPASL